MPSLWSRVRMLDACPGAMTTPEHIKHVRRRILARPRAPSRVVLSMSRSSISFGFSSREGAHSCRQTPFHVLTSRPRAPLTRPRHLRAPPHPHRAPRTQWVVTETVFKRARDEIDAKGKFDPSSLAVDDDGVITGTCAGSRPTDKYKVRVHVREPREDDDDDDGGAGEREKERAKGVEVRVDGAPRCVVEAECGCPASHNAGGFAQPDVPGQPPRRRQPKRSCKHSAGLLFWRMRQLTAETDPEEGTTTTGGGGGGGGGDGGGDRAADAAAVRASVGAAAVTAPPSAPRPPRPVPPGGKKRRVPSALLQAAAAAEEQDVAKRAKAAKKAGAKSPAAAAEKVTAAAAPRGQGVRLRRAAAVNIKTEPGLEEDDDDGGGGGGGGGAGPTTTTGGDVVDKVKRITDARLLAAAMRVLEGDRPREDEVADGVAPVGAEDGDVGGESVVAPAATVAPVKPPAPAEAPAGLDDLFSSFLPAAFRADGGSQSTAGTAAPAPAAAEVQPRPAPAPEPPSSAEETEGTEKPPPTTTTTDSEPPSQGEQGATGRKKMSFAEMMAGAGLSGY